MGFFSAFKKIVQGKPVFEVEDQNAAAHSEHAQQSAPQGAGSTPIARGPKMLPQMYIEQVECRKESEHIDCGITIKNYSHEQLELEKVEFLGKTREYNQFISADGEFETELYAGPPMANNYANQCSVFYKDASGDYFCSVHYVEYEKIGDNKFAINRIRVQLPVRDV